MTGLFLGQALIRRRGEPALNMRDILRRRGAITSVSIGQPTSVAQGMRARGKTVPPMRQIFAMVDTGASVSAIEDSVAKSLGLTKTGAMYIAGVAGAGQRPVYAAQIHVGPPAGPRYDPLQLAGVNFGAPDFSLLIGRDILADLELSYLGKQGKFSLTA